MQPVQQTSLNFEKREFKIYAIPAVPYTVKFLDGTANFMISAFCLCRRKKYTVTSICSISTL